MERAADAISNERLRQALSGVFLPPQGLPGHLIAICGFDGSGKTTQIERLATRLRARGRDVLVTRQPSDWYRNDPTVRHFLDSGGSSGEARILALLVAADRLRHIGEVVTPALSAGKVILCDRYVYASFVLFAERGLDPEFIGAINSGIPRPTLSLYLDVPPATLLHRIRTREDQRRKHEERSEAVIAGIVGRYLALEGYLERIDGTLPLDAVTDDIMARFDSACGSNSAGAAAAEPAPQAV